MARIDIKPPLFVSSPDLPVIKSPSPKRSRLSLKRSSSYCRDTCIREDDVCATKSTDLNQDLPPIKTDIEMIDLTCDAQDENASPNCSTADTKSEKPTSETETEEDCKLKVWTIGLPNCGNSCFVNSILQVLRYSPNFLNALHLLAVKYQHLKNSSDDEDDSHEITFFRHMHTLYTIMKKKEYLMMKNVDKDYSSSLIRPMKLVINSLRQVTCLFEEGEQHDAHELLITIISLYENACNIFKNESEQESVDNCLQNLESKDNNLPTTESPIDQRIKRSLLAGKRRRVKSEPTDLTFIESLVLGMEGKLRNTVRCLECEKKLEREESFATLEVTLPEEIYTLDSVDLRACLSQTTMLCGENKFFCETCQQHNEAEMSAEVISAPPILLLHFGCMGKFSVMSMEKTCIKILIPLSLETSECSDLFSCAVDENYKLYAVVLHIGRSTESGHYVCFIKDASQHGVERKLFDETLKSPSTRQNRQVGSSNYCCVTEEIMNFTGVDSITKWLLFDDDIVSPVVIDEHSDTFPYFNFFSLTASPCMLFYHKT